MDFSIREYKEGDREALKDCMEKLQEYIVGVDPLKMVRRAEEFGDEYTKWLLSLMKEENGSIYLAERNGTIIGCVAGMVPLQAPHDIAGMVPYKYGRVQELYVDEEFRGAGVGQALMQKMEEHFRANGCNVVYVEVFAPNTNAHEFYRSCGYADRDVNLMKKL